MVALLFSSSRMRVGRVRPSCPCIVQILFSLFLFPIIYTEFGFRITTVLPCLITPATMRCGRSVSIAQIFSMSLRSPCWIRVHLTHRIGMLLRCISLVGFSICESHSCVVSSGASGPLLLFRPSYTVFRILPLKLRLVGTICRTPARPSMPVCLYSCGICVIGTLSCSFLYPLYFTLFSIPPSCCARALGISRPAI